MKNALAMDAPSVMRTASKKEAEANQGDLNCVRIEVTDNGFTTYCSYDPKTLDPKKDRWSQMPDDEKLSWGDGSEITVASIDKMLAYIRGELMELASDAAEEKKGKKEKAAD
jgi:hypothetical protein